MLNGTMQLLQVLALVAGEFGLYSHTVNNHHDMSSPVTALYKPDSVERVKNTRSQGKNTKAGSLLCRCALCQPMHKTGVSKYGRLHRLHRVLQQRGEHLL